MFTQRVWAIVCNAPIILKKRLKDVYSACLGVSIKEEQWNTTTFPEQAKHSRLVSEVFERIRKMPGWFNIDDCAHFFLLLSLQSALGIKGDLLDIGSYHGRSAASMAYCINDDEKIVACDAFQLDTNDSYADKPTPQKLINNILIVNPELDVSRIEIHQCLSKDLNFDSERRFRFIHIDGGHSKEETMNDLLLSLKHILPHGIIVIDDYEHPDYPGVKIAVKEFLAGHNELNVLADMNRHGAFGRKLYLIREA